MRGDTSVLELALEELRPTRRVAGGGPPEYLEWLPAEVTLPIARKLVTRGDEASVTMGWELLVRHATAADVPILHADIQSALEAGDFDRVAGVLYALSRHPEHGPYAGVRTCFESTPDPMARRAAACVLRHTDPRFAEELAFERLWDCEAATQGARGRGDRAGDE